MYLQEVDNVFDLRWNEKITYGEMFHQNELQASKYNFELSDPEMLVDMFKKFESESKRLIEKELPLPAYEYCLKSSHTFNLLDARGAIGVAERANYIARVRGIANMCARSYLQNREKLGFPLLGDKSEK